MRYHVVIETVRGEQLDWFTSDAPADQLGWDQVADAGGRLADREGWTVVDLTDGERACDVRVVVAGADVRPADRHEEGSKA